MATGRSGKVRTSIAAVGVSAAVGAVLVANVLTAPAAEASVFSARGTVWCADGNVEGVWVVAGNQSGWAQLSPRANTSREGSFYKSINGAHRFGIHVGCGGSPSHWKEVDYSAWSIWVWPIDADVTYWCLNGTCVPADAGE